MLDTSLHPNTQAMLQAWRRMAAGAADMAAASGDFPEIVSRLFVIEASNANRAPFRLSGERMPALLGRDTSTLDFLTFWTGQDRGMIAGLLETIRLENEPGVIRAYGETIDGRRVELEIALAPLDRPTTRSGRMLGLYQTLGGEPMIGGRPIQRHRLAAVLLPEPKAAGFHLRLIASND